MKDKKYFIVSDVHGYCTILKDTLNEKGFDINNPEHILILAGDAFDRGREPKELFEFLTSIPKERFIYIRGNHEDLFIDCLNEINQFGDASNHHYMNGTVQTLLDICGLIYYKYDLNLQNNEVKERLQPYIDFINTSIDYYELGDYIITHGWIPATRTSNNFIGYLQKVKDLVYNPDWRKASDLDWRDARWSNGMQLWWSDIREPNKTIICGHFHTNWGHGFIHRKKIEYEPFIDEGIIAIDASTPRSGRMNCLVLEID